MDVDIFELDAQEFAGMDAGLGEVAPSCVGGVQGTDASKTTEAAAAGKKRSVGIVANAVAKRIRQGGAATPQQRASNPHRHRGTLELASEGWPRQSSRLAVRGSSQGWLAKAALTFCPGSALARNEAKYGRGPDQKIPHPRAI